MNQLNAHIDSLLNSNSTGVVACPKPTNFMDRPSSVIDEKSHRKITKPNEHRDKINKKNTKGTKSTRGGTPAPALQNRQKQVNTVLGIRNQGSNFIERSISNECIRSTARFSHHSNQARTRKGSAK